jgi:hypothetical protein
MRSWMLAALPLARTTAIELFSVGCMPVFNYLVAPAVPTADGDRTMFLPSSLFPSVYSILPI